MLSRPRIKSRLEGVLAFGLSVLLAVQVAVAFLPSASMAAVEDNGDLTLVLCSADGTRTINLTADGTADERPTPPSTHGHCPLCIVSADVPNCAFEGLEAASAFSILRYAPVNAPQVKGLPRLRADAIRAPPRTV